MVLDLLKHSRRYEGLGDRIAAAFAFLTHHDAASLEPSAAGAENSWRIDIRGDDIFALIQRYQTKSPDQAFWEAHRRYIDVQCVMEGAEVMGHAPLNVMQIVKPYDEVKDYMVLRPRVADQPMNFFTVEPGMFAIFMPQDAHMPGLTKGGESLPVKKIVVKVRAD